MTKRVLQEKAIQELEQLLEKKNQKVAQAGPKVVEKDQSLHKDLFTVSQRKN